MDNRSRRIGVLMPPGNVTCEREFSHYVPRGCSVHFSRLYRKTVSVDKEGLLSMIQSAETGSKALAQSDVEVILYACTSGSFLSGPGREDELGERIQALTGIPGITTSTAVIRALKALRAGRVYMITPYPDDVNVEEVSFLTHRDIEVPGWDAFRCPLSEDIRRKIGRAHV